MNMKQAAVMQFGNPRGAAGNVAGWVMAHRSSNRKRNAWAVSLLDVQPEDRVLEIGFGPGRAIAELARRSGHVYGIDRSQVMLRQASRRNAAAIRAGKVTLRASPVEELPFDGPFDAILAVNTLGFWTEPAARLDELRRRLAPGGRFAIVSQPRAVKETSPKAAVRLTALLEAAGFRETTTHVLELDPPAVCVVGSGD
jgi:ubiquinone/menaquinone biosynthesis C-methylase UbiE